jgi:hypothetical protein
MVTPLTHENWNAVGPQRKKGKHKGWHNARQTQNYYKTGFRLKNYSEKLEKIGEAPH